MFIKKLAVISSALILSACASKAISPGASRVQVHQQISSLLTDCKKLGPVSGFGTKPLGNAIGSTGAIQEAIGDLREMTYNLGGDSVALVNKEESVSSVRILGVAYRCF